MFNIFKDDNNWNEKAIVGFIAFIIMCLIMIADLVTGWVGKDLVINEFVYDSFVLVVLGCFGIAGLEKFAKKQEIKMSRRKNGVRKDWKKKLEEISMLRKKLKKSPENSSIRSKIKSLCSSVVMPKKGKR